MTTMPRMMLCLLCPCACLSLAGCFDSDSADAKPTSHQPPVSVTTASSVGDKSVVKFEENKTGDEAPIVILEPTAVRALNEMLRQYPAGETHYLRLRAVAGGCQGFMHLLDLDPNAWPEDQRFETSGIQMVVWKDQVDMLRGSRIDYSQEKNEKGFKVTNPNIGAESWPKWFAALQKQKHLHE